MTNFPSELIAQAKAAKSAAELLALAKDNNVDMTEEQANTYFEELNANNAISDDDLDAVAGGVRFAATAQACQMLQDDTHADTMDGNACPYCGSTQGYVAYCGTGVRQSATRSVKCIKCDKIIQNYVDKNKVQLC